MKTHKQHIFFLDESSGDVSNKLEKGKYNIIYADPPWDYGERNNPNTTFGLGAPGRYDMMTAEEICNLSVKNIAATNCALFLWCVFPLPHLQEALDVFPAWGFEYKTLGFAWFKINKHNGKPFFGVGYYTKSNVEVCLLGIKGKMKSISDAVSSVVIAPRREHSRKPDEVRERIVQLFGDLPRIELFAREKTPGWDVWGNEVESDIELGGIK